MQIWFTTKTTYTIADLRKLVSEEGVGYDPDFTSSARLVWSRGDRLLEGPDAKPIETDEVRWSTRAYARDHFAAGPVWLTAWSGFSYQLEQIELDDPVHPGRQRWCYEGAEHGFLQQNLLPPMPETEILSVSGTYGTFTGPDALEKYSRVKNGWAAIWWPIYSGLQGRVLPHTNGWGGSAFIAEMWRLHNGLHPKSDGKLLPFDPTEPNKLCRAILEAAVAALETSEKPNS